MACDCGASTATRVHPRFYGSFPRVLGRYVREQKIMSWEEAIRKSSWLPAATIGWLSGGLVSTTLLAQGASDPLVEVFVGWGSGGIVMGLITGLVLLLQLGREKATTLATP